MSVISETCPVCGGTVVEKEADTHRWIDQVRRNLLEKRYGTLKKVGSVYIP